MNKLTVHRSTLNHITDPLLKATVAIKEAKGQYEIIEDVPAEVLR